MAIIDGWCECAVCGEPCGYNEPWMDWVCMACTSGSWRDEIKKRVAEFRCRSTIPTILQMVSEKSGLSVEQICQKSRVREVTEARQVAMTMAVRDNVGMYSFIGHEIGNKDHSTVTHAVRTVRNLMKTNLKFIQTWQGILILPEPAKPRVEKQKKVEYKKSGSASGRSVARKNKEEKTFGK